MVKGQVGLLVRHELLLDTNEKTKWELFEEQEQDEEASLFVCFQVQRTHEDRDMLGLLFLSPLGSKKTD
jgi:hypothetical protein